MMKKTILHIATAVMLLAIFTACEKEALQAAFEGNNGKSIRILLNAQGDDVTRAVSRSDGNDAYGENTIATADVFFYNAGGTLIYNVAKENVTLSEPDANGVVTATVPMPSSDENIDLQFRFQLQGTCTLQRSDTFFFCVCKACYKGKLCT